MTMTYAHENLIIGCVVGLTVATVAGIWLRPNHSTERLTPPLQLSPEFTIPAHLTTDVGSLMQGAHQQGDLQFIQGKRKKNEPVRC